MTESGSFDNSTCKRVLDLLEPGDLTLGQVVIKRVAVVELGVNNVVYIGRIKSPMTHCTQLPQQTKAVTAKCRT